MFGNKKKTSLEQARINAIDSLRQFDVKGLKELQSLSRQLQALESLKEVTSINNAGLIVNNTTLDGETIVIHVSEKGEITHLEKKTEI